MKTELQWRLGKLPTVEQVKQLVDDKLITKEEARDILFNEVTPEKIDVDTETKALKEQIKFMEKVIDNLSKNKHSVITYNPHYPTRYWLNGGGAFYSGLTTAGSGTGVVTYTSSNT